MEKYKFILTTLIFTFIAQNAYAAISVPVHSITNSSDSDLGIVTIKKSKCGILLSPQLHNLPPGIHGFHIHDKAACSDNGLAAGGHLDPDKTNAHLGPYKNGHLGDLPVLIVSSDGTANLPVLAPRLTMEDVKGRSLMIHAGGDNYADKPEKMGGGGTRIACGTIE